MLCPSYEHHLPYKMKLQFGDFWKWNIPILINFFYPSEIQFSFAINQNLFADAYLIMEVFGLATELTPSLATMSDNSVSEQQNLI